MKEIKNLNVVLIQCVCPHYRVDFFKQLSNIVKLTLFYGKGEKSGAYKNAENIEHINAKKLFAFIVKVNLRENLVRLVFFPTLLYSLYKVKPDIVITEGITNIVNNYFLLLYKKIFKIPLISWESGRRKEKKKNKIRKIIEPFFIFYLKRFDAVITYNETGKRYFLSIGIEPEKIFIAQNSINIEECLKYNKNFSDNFKYVENQKKLLGLYNKKIVLYIGALEKRKKVHNLINVFKKLNGKINNLVCIIIGDGPEYINLLKLIKKLNIENNCFLLGEVINKKKYLYLYICNVFVQPGWNSLSIIEAMAFEKPVITVQHGGTEYEIINNNQNGIIIERDNLLDLQAKLENLLLSSIYAEKVGKKANLCVQNLTFKKMLCGFRKSFLYILKYYA